MCIPVVGLLLSVIWACDATWQGVVESDGKQHHFQSELQLLRWVLEQFSVL